MFNTETNGANFQYIIHVKHRPSLAVFFFFFCCISSSSHFKVEQALAHKHIIHIYLLHQPD